MSEEQYVCTIFKTNVYMLHVYIVVYSSVWLRIKEKLNPDCALFSNLLCLNTRRFSGYMFSLESINTYYPFDIAKMKGYENKDKKLQTIVSGDLIVENIVLVHMALI